MLADSSKPLGRTNIRQKAAADREAIYTSIVQAIRNGDFAKGSKLPTERELSEQFGAARNSVRQALDTLVREGTVSRQVGRGTFVTGGAATDRPPTSLGMNLSLQEILEVRALLEPQIANLVVERADDSDFAAMERCLDGIRDARDWSEYKEWKYELHLTMMRATGNRFLVQIFEAIIRSRREDQWGRAGDNGIIPDDVRAATLRANEHIVEALRAGRTDEASQGIRRYLNEILASVHGI
ncbi:FCD domain-containing protein [Actibacterium sp. MT2.3-13A]|uniref:FadR/GntR family transcriptional regulator n=1 Tax=Actibacterium sp. MT2.3-13A TaxID=2828332 RepID=UPI001BA73FD8|nr:FCD domain-containing protein [Actibacterium sp. MT2.3-13A]